MTAQEGYMGNCHPEKTKVNLGFATVDIVFFGVIISHVTFSCSQYLYIHVYILVISDFLHKVSQMKQKCTWKKTFELLWWWKQTKFHLISLWCKVVARWQFWIWDLAFNVYASFLLTLPRELFTLVVLPGAT